MSLFIDVRDAPAKRRAKCEGGQERHFTEGAVMIAFAMHLLKSGASAVDLHPDGEHGKRYDLKASLEAHGFQHLSTRGTTKYGGVYSRGSQTVTVTLRPGLGDVVASIGAKTLVAECKGGVVNSRHAGQLSRLRRGLCEAVGLLMARPLNGERHIAVVPETDATKIVANRMLPRASAASIEIALVSQDGDVRFCWPARIGYAEMKIGDALYFSPQFRFSQLNFDDTNMLVRAFQDRVEGFYLQPAARSLKANDAFAGGLVCCAAVELIAKVSGKEHPSTWLQRNVAGFGADDKLAGRFWNYFRDGLAHEGRVKSYGQFSGQFSLELPAMLTTIGNVLVVNPLLLLEAVQAAFQRYCEQMNSGQADMLANCLRRCFEAEVKAAKG